MPNSTYYYNEAKHQKIQFYLYVQHHGYGYYSPTHRLSFPLFVHAVHQFGATITYLNI